jgi:hypothetical protein
MIQLKELHKEDIAHRAYELYVQRGSEPGQDVQDWVRAEKELRNEDDIDTAKVKVADADRYYLRAGHSDGT